jgi:hypothetical protein
MTWQWVCLILGLAWWAPALLFIGYLMSRTKMAERAGTRVDEIMAKLPDLSGLK